MDRMTNPAMAAAAAANAEPAHHEGGVMSIILLLFGTGVAYVLTPVLSILLGLITLYCGWKFLKWRVDPADMFFWMKGKPSWTAVGLTFLCGLALLGISYLFYAHFDNHQLIGSYLSQHYLGGYNLSL